MGAVHTHPCTKIPYVRSPSLVKKARSSRQTLICNRSEHCQPVPALKILAKQIDDAIFASAQHDCSINLLKQKVDKLWFLRCSLNALQVKL